MKSSPSLLSHLLEKFQKKVHQYDPYYLKPSKKVSAKKRIDHETAMLLIDAAQVDGLTVAVGTRGIVLLSEDNGESWRQVSVPTRSMLTGVYFADRQHGWAVGHDAVILRTRDGGESWQRVYHDPEQERPFLDVWFRDANEGFVVGSYGMLLHTVDGGLCLDAVGHWHQNCKF